LGPHFGGPFLFIGTIYFMRLILRDREEVKEDSGRGFTAVQGMEESKIDPITATHRTGQQNQRDTSSKQGGFESFMNLAQKQEVKKQKIKDLEDLIYRLKRQGRWQEAKEAEQELAALTS